MITDILLNQKKVKACHCPYCASLSPTYHSKNKCTQWSVLGCTLRFHLLPCWRKVLS